MTEGPSAHLTWGEIACKDTAKTPYPLKWRTDPNRLPKLTNAFEVVRDYFRMPIRINSAYRTPTYNRTLPGAALHSQHMQGRALDMVPPTGVPLREFYDAIVSMAQTRDVGIRYVRGYPTDDPAAGFVHMDVRPSTRLIVVWGGERAELPLA